MSIYSDMIPIASIVPFNVGLSSATEQTMISLLGRPKMPLTREDQPRRASDVIRPLLVTADVGPFRCTGISPAVDSLRSVFAEAALERPDLMAAIGSAGMLSVRMRKPTSGAISTHISNHAWGTAIDLTVDGGPPLGDTGQSLPRGIAVLVKHFNRAGWYSGISFHDDMHFEVSEQKILAWHNEGRFTHNPLVA